MSFERAVINAPDKCLARRDGFNYAGFSQNLLNVGESQTWFMRETKVEFLSCHIEGESPLPV